MPINSNYTLGLPPDGSGKKLQIGYSLALDYTTLTGGTEFPHGVVISGTTSSSKGLVVESSPSSPTSGTILVFPNPRNMQESFFEVGETITVGGTSAVVSGITNRYISQTQIVGGVDPNNYADIDEYGSISVKYRDGHPLITLVGEQAIANGYSLGSYTDQYEENYYFSYIETGTTSHTWNSNSGTVTITAGAGNGNSITRRTHWTHFHQLGTSITAEMLITIPDPSKTDVERRWGLFSDADGYGFGMFNGEMLIGYRSSVSGTPVDTVVLQSDWNVDTLLGGGGASNLSELQLDPSKMNLYIVEYRGSYIRYSVVIGNVKVVVHEIDLTNSYEIMPIQYAHLPLSFEILTTGTTATDTDMIIAQSGVHSSGPITQWTRSQNIFLEPQVLDYADGFVPVLSIRASTTYHGKRNDSWAGITQIESFCRNAALNADQPVVFVAAYDSDLTGASWTYVPNTLIESDTSATSGIQGDVFDKWIANGTTCHRFDAPSIYDAEGVSYGQDGTQTAITIFARPLYPSTTANVSLVLQWEELI